MFHFEKPKLDISLEMLKMLKMLKCLCPSVLSCMHDTRRSTSSLDLDLREHRAGPHPRHPRKPLGLISGEVFSWAEGSSPLFV